MNTKKCRKCGIEKPLTEFYKDKSKKDGHRSGCKACKAQYRAQNKERKAEYDAQYRAQNKEKTAQYTAKNKEKLNEYSVQYRAQNKEKIAEYRAQYYLENREKELEKTAQYTAKNKEKILEYHAKYRVQNKEKILKRGVEYRSRPEVKERRSKYFAEYYSKRKSEQPNCIYQIENSINGRIYIGETTRGELRWREHLKDLRGNYHINKLLQEDFNKYGEEVFEWTILKEFEGEDKDALLLEEARTIQQYIQDDVQLYNITLSIEQLKMLMEGK